MKFEYRSVSYMYDVLPIVDTLSVIFPEYGLTVVTGANGDGKTTLFDLLIGDKLPSQGTVYINGQSTKVMKVSQKRELRRKLGIVHQYTTFSHHYTVEENIMVPLFVCGMKESDSRKRIMDILSEYELSHLRSKFPDQVSHRELKLLSCIQATIFEPDFLVADEPCEGFDNHSFDLFIKMIKPYMTENKGVIIFTQDNNRFDGHADTVFELSEGSLSKTLHSKKKGE